MRPWIIPPCVNTSLQQNKVCRTRSPRSALIVKKNQILLKEAQKLDASNKKLEEEKKKLETENTGS
jgi:hypothetical protein